MNIENLINKAVQASLDAGKEIMRIYESADFGVEAKSDNSPLTLADKASHEAIMDWLTKEEYPILSEEGKEMNFEERKGWSEMWIVDPLDGTKEFIKKNGEFTVNIAFIQNNKPLFGIIYVPVKKWLYVGGTNLGSYKMENVSTDATIDWSEFKLKAEKLPLDLNRKTYTVVASRSHMSPETEAIIEEFRQEHGEVELTSIGSSLKICLVAEGVADVYPRYAPTMEWDTAAGQAIAEGAGKQVIDYESGENMLYNRENLLNNWFTVN